MNTILITILGVVAVFVGLFIAIVISAHFTITLPLKRSLKSKSDAQLESELYQYHQDYFSIIGEQNKDVVEFKKLIETRDLAGLKKRWNKLSGTFVQLERKAGHSGRPLIMDYYDSLELWINELIKRNT